jgi:hypothetical protein
MLQIIAVQLVGATGGISTAGWAAACITQCACIHTVHHKVDMLRQANQQLQSPSSSCCLQAAFTEKVFRKSKPTTTDKGAS